jgi:hypothetical protein
MKTTDPAAFVELIRDLGEQSDKLEAMCEAVAKARHVREYDSDRRKRALAVEAAKQVGLSASAAETMARSSMAYYKSMKLLGEEFANAELIIARWDAQKIRCEVARSILSITKEQMRL